MRARCRCPHVTHYSLSRLINEIKKRLSHCFWELLQGLIGRGECLHRPPSNALSLTKRSDHGKRLPELRVRRSFLAFIHPLEPLLQWKRRRENEGEERERDWSGCSNMTFHTEIHHSNRWHLSYFSSSQTGFLTAWLLLVAVDVPAEISITGSSDLGTLGWN